MSLLLSSSLLEELSELSELLPASLFAGRDKQDRYEQSET